MKIPTPHTTAYKHQDSADGDGRRTARPLPAPASNPSGSGCGKHER
ncbi:hypothetical protein GCM10007079_31750 [Nocardiopsis terrae]|uniref:Uncharacterized protein n=1 Tax=Nocardiopsis terrae TaxID=372655 RepID=A0ABR9HJ02_9ACTN|nr:hypothetical protein [Nocardiopsis terrae]MBE1458997.1 hypothetical protein [Nocardiopsis terrae]GHC87516.1 hypothetical protein GCM10007079_31750 [Nocardiopsis terrae]